MFEFLTPKFGDFFDLMKGISGFLQTYYELRGDLGFNDIGWKKFKSTSLNLNKLPAGRPEELVKQFAQDVTRGYSSLTAGDMVVFEYTSLKQVKKSYFALIVGTKYGNGVFWNNNTKHDLMSCFLVDSRTDLNILSAVANVLNSRKTRPKQKTYQELEDPKKNADIRKKSDVSQDGMQAILPTSEFRTFILNIGMETIYKLNLNG